MLRPERAVPAVAEVRRLLPGARAVLPPLEPGKLESETTMRLRHSALAFELSSTTRCAAAASLNVRNTTGSSVGVRRIASIAARTDASCAGQMMASRRRARRARRGQSSTCT